MGVCTGFVMCGVCVCVGFVMCGCFDNRVGELVICVLSFTVFCIVCTVFLYCFVHVYLYLFCIMYYTPSIYNNISVQ